MKTSAAAPLLLLRRANNTKRQRSSSNNSQRCRCRTSWVFSSIGVVVVVAVWIFNLQHVIFVSQHATSATAATNARQAVAEQKQRTSENDIKNQQPEFHIVFSTGCNAFQDCTFYVFLDPR